MESLEYMQIKEQGSMPALNDAVTEGQRAIAEVQAAVVMAKKFPRNQKKAYENIMLACQRPSLAESAIYGYARGGTSITGPSIRLAESLALNWGNMQFGIRELEQRDGESTVEAYAWDIETNTRQTKTFQVQHKRHTKKGAYSLEDPRDIYELVANNGARRLRACILGVIPGDIVDAAVAQCEETLKAKADTSPEATKKLVEAFKAFGVKKEHIEKRLQRNLDAITPAQVVGMRKIYNSLKDGMSSAGDWFDVVPAEEQAKGIEGLKARIKIRYNDNEKAKTSLAEHLAEDWYGVKPDDTKAGVELEGKQKPIESTQHGQLEFKTGPGTFGFDCFDLNIMIDEAKSDGDLDDAKAVADKELVQKPEYKEKAYALIEARRKLFKEKKG